MKLKIVDGYSRLLPHPSAVRADELMEKWGISDPKKVEDEATRRGWTYEGPDENGYWNMFMPPSTGGDDE